MGMFWDLIQQSEIEEQKEKAVSIEQRVLYLEEELEKTRLLLIKTLHLLEKELGKDIDGDGKVG
ncbi:hypothetical protein [Algoriphagus halophilus]|uniref:Uncharacterized protein n=2 Tax=Algoriphagus halophilus TaxID=226505 RepID=A0A1N6G192_9BACT|nr:hypothetical protein [Algoriphagus halophilus]SIO01211.1 hypothetical protein SAMN05444394_2886 [Algoriphagus halophilus]